MNEGELRAECPGFIITVCSISGLILMLASAAIYRVALSDRSVGWRDPALEQGGVCVLGGGGAVAA